MAKLTNNWPIEVLKLFRAEMSCYYLGSCAFEELHEVWVVVRVLVKSDNSRGAASINKLLKSGDIKILHNVAAMCH